MVNRILKIFECFLGTFCSILFIIVIFDTDSYAKTISQQKKETVVEKQSTIRVEAFGVSGDAIVPGEQFDFKVTVHRSEGTLADGEISLSLFMPNGISLVYPNLPKVYFEDIAPDSSEEIIFKCIASDSLEVEKASFSILLKYGLNEEDLSVQVPISIDDSMFIVTSHVIPGEVSVGKVATGTLYFKARNEENLRNVSLSVYVDGTENGKFLIGNMHTGASKSQSISFTITNPGKHELEIGLSCNDSDGVLHEVKVYKCTVEAIETNDDEQFVTVQEENFWESLSKFELFTAIACALGIIVSVIGIILINKRCR